MYSPTGTQPDLQTAVDALNGPGVVVVPPGQWEHLGSLDVAHDDVTIIGAGSEHVTLARKPPPSSAGDAVRDLYTAPFVKTKGTSGFRLAHVAIQSWPASGGTEDLDVGVLLSTATDFRVDHCSFRFTGDSGVKTTGESHGVVDHCRFEDIYEETIGNYGYGVSVYGVGEHAGEPFGSARATFVEDSTFEGCRHAVASNRGARYVFRHNTVRANTVSHAVDTHGAEYPPSPKPDCDPCYDADPGNPGTEWAVVHDNLVEAPGYDGYAITLRGGKGLVYRNTVRDYATAIRLSRQTPQPTGPVYLWDNDVVAPTQLVVGVGACCGSGPEWETTEPPGYTPFAYPHPLVLDVRPDAGPDQRVMLPAGGGPAEVFVDASASRVHKDEVQAVRWFYDPAYDSECVRDVLEIEEGVYTLLLALLTEGGTLAYDTARVEVLPHGPLDSSPSWADLWFAPFTGAGEGKVSFVVTPGGGVTDAYVGLAGRHAVGEHADHAMQVRINDQGFFDARNGETYEAEAAIAYEAGEGYQVEVSFDVAAQRYDVTIDGQVLADGYRFRTSATSIGQLTAWHAEGAAGLAVSSIELSGEQAGPDPACREVVDAGVDADVPEPDAGVPDAAADASVDAQEGGVEPPAARSEGDDGCACRAGPATPGSGYAAWLALLVAVWAGLRVTGARRGCVSIRRGS